METKSPCTSQCFYDQVKDQCTSCFRTLEEIGSWYTSSEDQKREVLKKCKERRAVAESGLRQ